MKINIHFLIFLCISLIATLIDYFVYLFGIKYTIALLISFISVLIIVFLVIKHKKIHISFYFHKYDLIFYAFLFIKFVTSISIPDVTYDTVNYHIYLQEAFNIKKLTYDFIPGTIRNTFLFPLGDRMFYIFRYLLGYRLGTIPSYYAIIVIYYQMKNILKLYFKDTKLNNFLISVLPSLIFVSVQIYDWIGTYYIDIFCIVYILEILYILLKNKNIFNNKNFIFYIFLLSGIATGIKITNILFIAPLLFFFFIKYIKEFKWKNIIYYLIGLVIYFIPIILYLLCNYIETGSMLFPYYNNIFKSIYFDNYSWHDVRFYRPSLLKFIIWPFYVSVIEEGYGDNAVFNDYIWAIGYIVMTLSMIVILYRYFIKDKKPKEETNLIYINIIFTLVWILMMYGYMRYALVISVIYVLWASILIIKLFNMKWFNKFIKLKFINLFNNRKILVTFFVLFILCECTSGIYISLIDEGIKENYKYLFVDRSYQRMAFDAPVLVASDCSIYATMLRTKDVPIINIRPDDTYNDEIKDVLYDMFDSYEYFYMPVDKRYYTYAVNTLKNLKLNYKIITVYTPEDDLEFLDARDELAMFVVSKKELE